jgi:hypothetical protein
MKPAKGHVGGAYFTLRGLWEDSLQEGGTRTPSPLWGAGGSALSLPGGCVVSGVSFPFVRLSFPWVSDVGRCGVLVFAPQHWCRMRVYLSHLA